MHAQPYTHIIWDWNGTLLDDVRLAIGVMNRLLEDHAYPPLTHERYVKIFDFPVRDYYVSAGFDLGKHEFAGLSDRFCGEFEESLSEAALHADAISSLERLAMLTHFVLSNTEQEALHRMLHRFDLSHHFTAVCGLNTNHATGKVGVGHDLMKSHALEPSRSILVGDTTHDAEVADALGVACILLSHGHNDRARLEATGFPVEDSLSRVCDRLLGGVV